MLNFKTMPKIELHVHLDGSIDPSYIAGKLNESIKEVESKMQSNNSKDLNEYLTKFDLPIEFMQTKEDLVNLSALFAQSLKDENVIYAEVRFAPQFHISECLSFDEVVESVLLGLSKVNIKINLILCIMRGMSDELNYKTIECAKKYLNKGVVAVDLAGAEALYKTENYKSIFLKVQQLNIPYTIHAGEADGISSILSAINFGATRIGHGVRVIEDEKIIQLVKDKRIILEICPKSNIDTKVVSDYSNHPIRKIFDRKILVTINTDNRTVSNITLTKEYENLNKYLDFSIEEIKQMNINAINASFLNKEEKNKLIIEYLKEYENQKKD